MKSTALTFISNLNATVGSSLISIATVLVVARFVLEMCKGGFGGNRSDYALVLRDFVLLIVLINSFDVVHNLINELPSLFDGLATVDDINFKSKVKKLFHDAKIKKILFWEIDGAFLIGARAFFLNLSKGLYTVITLSILSFYSIGVFSRTMLGMKSFTDLMIGVVLFSACYPLIFAVVDTLILQAFAGNVDNDVEYGAFAMMGLGSFIYAMLPIITIKMVMTKGVALAKSVAGMMSAPIGFKTGARFAGTAAKAGFRTGSKLGNDVESRKNNGYPTRESRNDRFIAAQRNKKQNLKNIKKNHKAAGIDPTDAINKEKNKFMDEWGQEYRERSSARSGIKGYGKAAKHASTSLGKKIKSRGGKLKQKISSQSEYEQEAHYKGKSSSDRHSSIQVVKKNQTSSNKRSYEVNRNANPSGKQTNINVNSKYQSSRKSKDYNRNDNIQKRFEKNNFEQNQHDTRNI